MTVGVTATIRPNVGKQRFGSMLAYLFDISISTDATYAGTGVGIVVDPGDFDMKEIHDIVFSNPGVNSDGGVLLKWDRATASIRIWQSDDAVDEFDEETAVDSTTTVTAWVYGN